MADDALHIYAGNNQTTKSGVPFPDPCVVRIVGADGNGIDGIAVLFTLRGAAATFPSPPSPDGITWRGVTSSNGTTSALPITPYFPGTVELHVTAETIPSMTTIDFELNAT